MKRRTSKEEKAFNSLAALPKIAHFRAKQDLMYKCDLAFAKVVKMTSGGCKRCGRTIGLFDCAHTVSKTYMILRWNIRNAEKLCRACHGWWHDHPKSAEEWYRGIKPQEWEWLQREKLIEQMSLSVSELQELYNDLSARINIIHKLGYN